MAMDMQAGNLTCFAQRVSKARAHFRMAHTEDNADGQMEQALEYMQQALNQLRWTEFCIECLIEDMVDLGDFDIGVIDINQRQPVHRVEHQFTMFVEGW